MKTRLRNLFFPMLLTLLIFQLPIPVFAANPISQQNQIIDAANKQQDAFDAAFNVSTPGPAEIKLGDQATLHLPENYFFIPSKEASHLLRTLGNKTGPEFMGLVIPKEHIHWFITIDYIKSGYIKDTAAKYWNIEELLEDVRKSTVDENQERTANGISPLNIAGWIEPPLYDSVKHRLVWSVLGKTQDDVNDSNHESVNYNNYLLGRDGYFALNLVTSYAAIADDKINARAILNALTYNEGKRYEDFNHKTDPYADYDLTTLVTSRVEKISLLALASFAVLKVWKFLLLCFGLWLLTIVVRTVKKVKPETAPETAK